MSGQAQGQVTFGETLKRIMHERRIGIDTLALETRISARLIGKYRSGSTVPRDPFGDPTENARKLASALGVPVDELLPAPDDESTEEAA